MKTVYVYLLDTMADWETGYILSELNSKRYFKKDAPQITLKMVSTSLEPIHSMGGLTIVPDCTIKDIEVTKDNMLILPGANTWNDPKHNAILAKANEFLQNDAAVCAICGATVALAGTGALDERPHTSNGAGFLEMFCPDYKGQSFYVDTLSYADNNLITAGSAGGLLWAKQIIEYLGVFKPDTLEAWHAYFSTGSAEHFFALMQTLQ